MTNTVTLYVAGPMTGLPDWNYPAFHIAAQRLRDAGYTVLNPAETDDGGRTRSWSWYLRRALAQVVQADGIALLGGWSGSRGALLEVHVAGQLGMPIGHLTEWLAAAETGRELAADRFWSKVDVDPLGCWIWTAATDHAGYGRFRAGQRTVFSHRHAYELLVGEIPDGLTLDHLCKTHACVNPDHLEPVTAAENALRGESPNARNARKRSCHRGHPFTPENTLHVQGRRRCRECVRIRDRARR